MAQHELLRTQKNEVFEAIRLEDLVLANFSWVTEENKYRIAIPVLRFHNSPYFFQFGLDNSEDHYCTYSPGDKTFIDGNTTITWVHQLSLVHSWLHFLKREIEAPDLWQEMRKYQSMISLALPDELVNETISGFEAEQFADRLTLLADRIEKKFELNDEQNKFVRKKLIYLAEAAKRQPSADLVHTAIGVFGTIAMGLALAPEEAKELWQLIESAIGGIIHLIGS